MTVGEAITAVVELLVGDGTVGNDGLIGTTVIGTLVMVGVILKFGPRLFAAIAKR